MVDHAITAHLFWVYDLLATEPFLRSLLRLCCQCLHASLRQIDLHQTEDTETSALMDRSTGSSCCHPMFQNILVSYEYHNGSNHNPALVQFAKVEAAMLCPLLMPPVESSTQLGLLILPNTPKLASQAVSMYMCAMMKAISTSFQWMASALLYV